MTKPWRPHPNVVPLRRPRRWTRAEAYWAPAPKRSGVSGTSVAVVLVAAVSAGLAVGLGWRAEPGAPVRVEASDASGVRASFGFCHTGGRTNCVVDGDTFYLGGEKVRIAGIDAPETHDYRCASEKALGDRATAELRTLLNSGAVTMTSVEPFAQSSTLSENKGRDRDTYGRLLRNVAVDGADVGEALISAGVAREYGTGRRGWC